jgi:hypothetical protein
MKEIAEGAARERGQRLAASAEVDFYQDICCLWMNHWNRFPGSSHPEVGTLRTGYFMLSYCTVIKKQLV